MATALRRRMQFVVAVLLVASLLLESCGVAPAGEGNASRQDARMLLLAIHSQALGEEDAEGEGLGLRGGGGLLRPAVRPEANPIDEVKAAIQDLQAECERAKVELANTLPEADMSQEIAALDQACQAEIAALQATLAQLRYRRDKSWWRRAWLGRRLAGAWQRVKRTVRKDAPLLVLAAVTGGGALVKKYLIQTGRSALRAEGRSELGRILARRGVDLETLKRANLDPGEWPPSGSRRGRQTADSEGQGPAEAPAVTEDFSPTAPFELPADGLWTAECKLRPCAGCKGEWTWTLAMNMMVRSFDIRGEYNLSEIGQGGWLYTTHVVYQGVGEITEDGMLHGPWHETQTLTWTKEGVVGGPQVTENENNMYGAISADLESICIDPGEDPGSYDIDYIRRIGREAFFGPDMGCTAECTIGKSP